MMSRVNSSKEEVYHKFITDYQSYFERLVKFVEDDPLEKNNLKSGSSGSSDEDDVKPNKKR